jgi:hypothetical protein
LLIAEDKRDEAGELCSGLISRPHASLIGDNILSFTAERLPMEAVCEVVKGGVMGWGKLHRAPRAKLVHPNMQTTSPNRAACRAGSKETI